MENYRDENIVTIAKAVTRGVSLDFEVNEDFLIMHTLGKIRGAPIYYEKNDPLLFSFYEHAKSVSPSIFDLVTLGSNKDKTRIGYSFERYHDWEDTFNDAPGVMRAYVASLKRDARFAKILSETLERARECKAQWENNYDATKATVEALTGLDLDKNISVYITHPRLNCGKVIETVNGVPSVNWGMNDLWPNYTTVYLWHEALHWFFEHPGLHDKWTKEDIEKFNIDHVIIQLIADYELALQLNGDANYLPHKTGEWHFPKAMEKALPIWNRYKEEGVLNVYRLREMLSADKGVR